MSSSFPSCGIGHVQGRRQTVRVLKKSAPGIPSKVARSFDETEKNQIRIGRSMHEPEGAIDSLGPGVRHRTLVHCDEHRSRLSEGRTPAPSEEALPAPAARSIIPGRIIAGRSMVPFIDKTTIAANKSPASRLNSTSGPPRRKWSQLQRCSVIGITTNSSAVKTTRRRLNGRAHWLLSLIRPRYHALQMVSKVALTSFAGSTPACSNHEASFL